MTTNGKPRAEQTQGSHMTVLTGDPLQDTSSAQRWVQRLEERGRSVEPNPDQYGAYLAQCPAHPDGKPSLVITPIEGQVLVHCRAGCLGDDVLKALDFTRADYYDSPAGACYVYTDERGITQRTVYRDPDKNFTQDVRPSRGRAKDGQRLTGKGRTDLYRLPRVIDAVKAGQVIYLVEGEKDAHALEGVGCVATTAPQGASNFHLADLSPLKGTKVWAIPDKDAAGERWAEKVQAGLADYAAELVWLEPGNGCKDAADHVARYGSPSMEVRPAPASTNGNGTRRLKITRASEIQAKATRWLWEEENGRAKWVPLGGLVLLAGREGVGKTTIAYGTVAKITRGTLPGDLSGQSRSVVISATEDAWAETVVPRLLACGADLDRVFRIEAVTPEGLPESVKLPEDLAELERLIKAEGVVLLLLDPLMGSVSGKLDSHKDHEVRIALEPLSRLAADCQVSIIGLIHENKGKAADLLDRIMASKAFAAVARGVLYAAREDKIPTADEFELAGEPREHFLFGQPKNNLAAKVPWTERYHIEGVRVGYDEEQGRAITGSRIVWDGKAEGSVQDIVIKQESRTPDKDRPGPSGRLAGEVPHQARADRFQDRQGSCPAGRTQPGHAQASPGPGWCDRDHAPRYQEREPMVPIPP